MRSWSKGIGATTPGEDAIAVGLCIRFPGLQIHGSVSHTIGKQPEILESERRIFLTQ
jgi:hypothetical protein